MTDFPLTFHTLKLVKALLFDIPEDWKRYPFRGESPRNPALYRLLYVGRNPLPQGNPGSKVYYNLKNSRVTLANKPVHHYHYHYLFFWASEPIVRESSRPGIFSFLPPLVSLTKWETTPVVYCYHRNKQTNKQKNKHKQKAKISRYETVSHGNAREKYAQREVISQHSLITKS